MKNRKKNALLNSRLKNVEKHIQNNEFDNARIILEKICQTSKTNIQAISTLAAVYGKLGRLEDSIAYSKKAIDLNPRFAQAHCNIGNAYLQLNKPAEAIEHLLKAISIDPNDTVSLINIAAAYDKTNDSSNAEKYYETCLGLTVNNEIVCNNYALFQQKHGHDSKALNLYNRALAINPGYQMALLNRAKLYFKTGEFDKAVFDYKKLLDSKHYALKACIGLGNVYYAMNYYRDSLYYFKRSELLGEESEDTQYRIAELSNHTGNIDQATSYYKIILEKNPEHVDAACGLSFIELKKGNISESWKLIDQFYSRGIRTSYMLIVLSYLCKHYENCDEVLNFLDELINSIDNNNRTKASLIFASARLYDSRKEYDKAFQYYDKANKLLAITYDIEQTSAFFERMKSYFNRDTFSSLPQSGSDSDIPVFIVGMPRSGTSLVEQILSAHQDIHGAGELINIKRIASLLGFTVEHNKFSEISPNQIAQHANQYLYELKNTFGEHKRITDKAPLNGQYLGMINLLFPNARIIYCVRNALDTCLSCYFHDFIGDYKFSYSLKDVANFHNIYKKLMEHWIDSLNIPIFTLHYEDLVKQPETQIRKLVDFCDIEWDEACLDFYKSKRTVSTSSLEQVRQPIYTSSINRYKNYLNYIQELQETITS